jgi:P-47 protein
MPIPNVDTYHWDTVYVASLEVLNEVIKKTGSFPSQFDYTDTATGVAIKGAWSDWALDVGGSGALVQMQTTIASGTATGINETGDLAGGIVTIQFELEQVSFAGKMLPDPTAKPGTGVPRAQRFPQEGSSQVTVTATSFPKLDPKKSPILKDILQTIFQNYFNAHLTEIKATFHVMMINEVADKDGFQWLKPSAISYAVGGPSQHKTLANTAFGILAMTDGGSIGPLQEQSVDISALIGLPDGANSAFVVSPEKVVQHLLWKGAICTIQGSTESDFSISDSGLNIVTAKDVIWGHFQLTDGSIISPKIEAGNFLMRMEGDHIHLEINNASYSPTAGVTVYMNLEQDIAFNTVKRDDGKYIFIPDLKSFGKPKIHSNVVVAEWLKITEIVIGVVGGLAALAGGISMLADFLAAGASTTISSGTEAAVDFSEDLWADAENSLDDDEWTRINKKSAQNVDDGINDPGNANQVQIGSFLKSSQFRAYCGITIGLSGLSGLGMAAAGWVVDKQYEKLPPFDNFAANVLGASQFPVLPNYELLGASLRTSLVAGIKLS